MLIDWRFSIYFKENLTCHLGFYLLWFYLFFHWTEVVLTTWYKESLLRTKCHIFNCISFLWPQERCSKSVLKQNYTANFQSLALFITIACPCTKINNFQIFWFFRSEHYILGFEVPMHDFIFVTIQYCWQQLFHVYFCLVLCDSLLLNDSLK